MIRAVYAFLIALAVSYILTPFVRSAMVRMGIFEDVNSRKIHTRRVPTLGGLAIMAAFSAAVLCAGEFTGRTLGLFWGGLVLALVGAVDDMVTLSARSKFAGQFLAAGILMYFGIRIEFITNPLGGMLYLGHLSFPVTLLWIVGITNAVNFIDGLDGLAAGVSAIASFTLLAVAVQQGQPEMVLLAAAAAGSVLGFLRYNFNPARIFMGDTGSMFLGFMLAAVAAKGALKGPAAMTLVVPILALGIPILDAMCAIIRRSQNGRSIFEADRGHFHHRLLELGLTQRQAVGVVYVLSAFLGVTAVVLNGTTNMMGFIALVAVGAVFLLVAKRIGVLDLAPTAHDKRAGRMSEGFDNPIN